jgi:hypothetical protein
VATQLIAPPQPFETGATGMVLNDLVSIAVIVQGFLFIVSIALVWYQLRDNASQIRASNTQKLVELSIPFYLQLAQDRALTELWQRGMQNLDDLDEIDRTRYNSLLTWWLMLHENIYHQWRKQLIDEDTYNSWTRDLEYYVRRMKLDSHWPQLNSYFEASFAEHVTTIITRLSQETKVS